MTPLVKQTLWLTCFSVAMGFLEAAVVVYLRLLYYPNGFQFPLVPLDSHVVIVEVLREAATVVMLIGVAVLAGRNANQRIAFFLLAFAIWDIFYYVFLKLILDWPSSWLTWDILFLIPAPWVGPVLSALIACSTMIVFVFVILQSEAKGRSQKINSREWILIASGSLGVIVSWLWDFVSYSGRTADMSRSALETLSGYIPTNFNWPMFGTGEVVLLIAIFSYWKRNRN